MEPPPLAGGPIPTTTTTTATVTGTVLQQSPTAHINYADSLDSSPRSRNTDSWDEQQPPPYAGGGKLRLMCSYGGHIFPRPHDKCLSYVGGDTRIVVADRHSSLADLAARLSKTLLGGRQFCLKYQLPNEDLDSLISVTTDEDLENMIEEYDRINSNSNSRSSRLRLFLFPTKPDSASSIGSLLENSTKSEDWFVHALNGATSGSTKVFSESSSVNCLLGLDDDIGNGNSTVKDVEPQLDGSLKNSGNNNVKNSGHDVQSVPDSPMVDKTSSFGSTCSTPSLANLPPIRVHVEDNQRAVGIEEQFSHIAVGGVGGRVVEQKQQEEGGVLGVSSPPAATATVVAGKVIAGVPVVVGGEYAQTLPQQQLQQPQQFFQKPYDLPSPDSVSSEGSVTNPLSRQRHFVYQEQGIQIQSGSGRVSANSVDQRISDPNCRGQVQQQVQDAGYALPVQFDQHPQIHQPQQYVHAGQYIHHTPAGPVPLTSYFPVYPSQQQTHPQHPALEHQYPIYFVHSRPTQAYTLPVQQTNYSDSSPTTPSNCPQTPPPPSVVTPATAYNPARNPPASKPEMIAGGYRVAAAAAPQLVQVNAGQHQPQYVGYSQIHHPSQSIAPTSATAASYVYEYGDPTHAQIYYTQPLAPQLAAQYQTMTSSRAAGIPETSSQLPAESVKQQIRMAQP